MSDIERISVYHERDWCGFFVLVIPVMLPVRATHDRFYVRGDEVVKTRYRHLHMLGFFCHWPIRFDKDGWTSGYC